MPCDVCISTGCLATEVLKLFVWSHTASPTLTDTEREQWEILGVWRMQGTATQAEARAGIADCYEMDAWDSNLPETSMFPVGSENWSVR